MPFPVNTYVPPFYAFLKSVEALRKLHIDIYYYHRYMNLRPLKTIPF